MELLKKNLDIVKKKINEEDYDWVHLIIGKEGTGKTTLALQICKYVDPTFRPSLRIPNSVEELKMILRHAKKGQAILIDEGALFFYSGDVMTRDVKEAIKLFTAIRSFNLFFCICVPNYYDIVSRIRDHRVKSACRVVKRGWFWFYSRRKLNKIKRDRYHNREIFPEPDFRESFPKVDDATWQEYLQKKREILYEATDTQYVSTVTAAKMLGVTRQTVRNMILKGLIPARKIGQNFKIKRSFVLDMIYSQGLIQQAKVKK